MIDQTLISKVEPMLRSQDPELFNLGMTILEPDIFLKENQDQVNTYLAKKYVEDNCLILGFRHGILCRAQPSSVAYYKDYPDEANIF